MLNEAESLLAGGRSFGRRIGTRSRLGYHLFGWKPGSCSIYTDDGPFIHLDLEGRWWRAYLEGRHVMRSWQGRVCEVARYRQGTSLGAEVRWLDSVEARRVDKLVRDWLIQVQTEHESVQSSLLAETPPDANSAATLDDVRRILLRTSDWEPAGWLEADTLMAEAKFVPHHLPPQWSQRIPLGLDQADRSGRGLARRFALLGSTMIRLRGLGCYYIAGKASRESPWGPSLVEHLELYRELRRSWLEDHHDEFTINADLDEKPINSWLFLDAAEDRLDQPLPGAELHRAGLVRIDLGWGWSIARGNQARLPELETVRSQWGRCLSEVQAAGLALRVLLPGRLDTQYLRQTLGLWREIGLLEQLESCLILESVDSCRSSQSDETAESVCRSEGIRVTGFQPDREFL